MIKNLSRQEKDWFLELKSINDKTKCDSVVIPADIVANLNSNDKIDWHDEENYEPESEL